MTALSGTETVEQAYGLAKLLRTGLGAHAAVLPEGVPDDLDSFRAPLSAIRDATAVVVLCDEPVVERAPVVDLWIKAARRNGAKILMELPQEPIPGSVLVTDDAERATSYAHASRSERPPSTCRAPANARGVADAWSAAGDGEAADVGRPRLLDHLRRRGGRPTRRCGKLATERGDGDRASASSRARSAASAT